MPTYVYQCDNEKCEHSFEQIQRMADNALVKCPICKKKSLHRVFFSPIIFVKGEAKTIGQLADRNSKKMSTDEKQAIEAKYKKNKKEVLGEKPWYKQNQTKSTKQIANMTPEQKRKYIENG